MKTSGLFLLLFIAYNLSAQSLTKDKMMPFGTVMHLQAVTDSSIIDTTVQGSGKTWDYSAFQDAATTYSADLTVYDPTKTSASSSFPTANYAIHQSNPNDYVFYELTDTALVRVGDYDGLSDYTTYDDPRTDLIFPTTLGSSHYDTWYHSDYLYPFGGRYDIKCVGSGTLKLPGNKTYNALMVRAHWIDTDVFDIYVYFWYNADNGETLVEDIFGNTHTYERRAYYNTGGVTAGVADKNTFSQIHYTNPVSNNLTVNLTTQQNEGNLRYSIIDVLGKEVNTGVVEPAGTNYFMNINMKSNAPGIYFLNLTTLSGEKIGSSAKVVKM